MDHPTPSIAAAGETTAWGWFVPTVWRAFADSESFVPPERPTELDDLCAWWAPLPMICLYSLGWRSVASGLERWMQAGRDTADPRFDLIQRWWGRDLDDFLTWMRSQRRDWRFGSAVADALHLPPPPPGPDLGSLAEEDLSPSYLASFGTDGDRLHLVGHAQVPIQGDPAGPAVRTDTGAILMLATYEGWYRRLHEAGEELGMRSDGRSHYVDVVVRPTGWLGTYRLSRKSGRWFAGRHRWHELGI
jgi:hypothetical protein